MAANEDAQIINLVVSPTQLMTLICEAGEEVLQATSAAMLRSRDARQNIIAIEKAVERLMMLIAALKSTVR